MSLFTVDSNNVFGVGVQEAGKYNVKIVKAEVGTTGRGQQKLTLDYEVVDGKYKGGQIRYQVMTWDDEQDHFDMTVKRFNTFLVAVGVKDGAPIDTLNQIANGVVNRTLAVDAEWGDPNSKGNVYLQVYGYHKVDPEGSKPNGVKRPNGNTTNTPANTQPANTSTYDNNGDQIDISDDDLPF
ncbi:DUF669 domain-containing protein [Lactiplantibacillus plantarum]|uniref:DUF669 domain-containing protein n=1 Tax=Lactiplantibacillus plantarum TaxID=1590 RepID=UPI00084FAF92|nr:DUF669 domain-containing protein [Lactiplantibacillus plantarum]AUV71623.1 DUF669 domain-containing protein [Lactiplantibacillus plantarum subsp. plantarum]WKF83390.1 DUF669 domain-containing protein [Lactiplantibacillus plantarum]WKF87358.1 DUF669 domain-containing protein [Lactiplantibacillus plantarum]